MARESWAKLEKEHPELAEDEDNDSSVQLSLDEFEARLSAYTLHAR